MLTTQTKRTAAKLAVKPLTLTITLPAQAVPLLRALAAVSNQTLEQAGGRAVVWWLQSDDAMERIDDEVQALLAVL
jgi:hypothetical protein